MSIAPLITLGIGPGASIALAVTGGYAPGTAAPVQTVYPHDDYIQYGKDLRPWWQTPRNLEGAINARIQRDREELGIVPKPEAPRPAQVAPLPAPRVRLKPSPFSYGVQRQAALAMARTTDDSIRNDDEDVLRLAGTWL